MKYAVDQIVGDIVILENLDTSELIEVDVSLLPEDIYDGMIVKYVDGVYFSDKEAENERFNRIQEKLNRLKRLKKYE